MARATLTSRRAAAGVVRRALLVATLLRTGAIVARSSIRTDAGGTSAKRQRNVSSLWSGARMARFLVSCAVLLVMLVVAPAASAILIDPVANWARSCSIVGTRSADRLSGTASNDRVCGLGGADRIRGERGRDVLLGGAGADALWGGGGADRLDGGPGPDGLSGGTGRDIAIYGGRPVVVTIGAGANDGVARERDNLKADIEDVQGGPGNDMLAGNGRSNRLFGGGGRDRLVGRGGSDMLISAGGDDSIDARDDGGARGAGGFGRPRDLRRRNRHRACRSGRRGRPEL
jgi:Ca2+-binding RTX toxin-like protein